MSNHLLVGNQSNGSEDADRMRIGKEYEAWHSELDKMIGDSKDRSKAATVAMWLGIRVPVAYIIITASGLWLSKAMGWIS